jgi:hypothetical protein
MEAHAQAFFPDHGFHTHGASELSSGQMESNGPKPLAQWLLWPEAKSSSNTQ